MFANCNSLSYIMCICQVKLSVTDAVKGVEYKEHKAHITSTVNVNMHTKYNAS